MLRKAIMRMLVRPALCISPRILYPTTIPIVRLMSDKVEKEEKKAEIDPETEEIKRILADKIKQVFFNIKSQNF